MAAPPYMSKKPPMPKRDLSNPGGFGSSPKAPPMGGAPADPDSDSDMDMGGGGGGGGVMLTLDDIKYHDQPEACALCKRYGQDGTCEVVQQQVNPDGGCRVFSPQDSGSDAGGAPAPMGADMPMSGGGAPSGLPS